MHADPLRWGITHGIYAYLWGYMRDVSYAARVLATSR